MTLRQMRLPTAALLALLAAQLAVAFGTAAPARAQWGDSYDAPRYDPYAAPRRNTYREDAGRAPRRYAPPQEAPRQFYWPWEERPQTAAPRPAPAPGVARPHRPRPPSVAGDGDAGRSRRSPRPAPAIAKPAPVAPKTTPNTQVAVFGDSLASYLAKGLDEVFAENPDVGVVDRSRGDTGIVRRDVVDWAKAADEYLKANPKVAYGLFMVGVNDRQAMREGDQTLEPLSDKWREAYAARIDALVKVFVERKIPLIWVGVPPVRFDTLSRDLATINDIARERVQKAGQTYVDIWPGFVDDKNRYAAVGPDLDGQRATLRTPDGIHFTGPGARKVAHFADVELKRMMSANGTLPTEQPAAVATTPGGTAPAEGGAGLDDASALDRKITAMLPSLPEPPGIPSLPVKPAAGPVVPLGRPEVSPGGALTSGRPSREGDATGTVERTLLRGAAPMPQPGRADDFKWPPG